MPCHPPAPRPEHSPWGTIQAAEQILPGIWHVTTASHGGFILSDGRQAAMPFSLVLDQPAYEEDADYALAVLGFCDEFTAKGGAEALLVRNAHDTVRNWHPGRYAAFTGEPVAPRTSNVLALRDAYGMGVGSTALPIELHARGRAPDLVVPADIQSKEANMSTATLSRAETVARLNDRARLGLDRTAKTMFTRSCLDTFCAGDALSALIAQAELLRAMRHHQFENDEHGERDFGAFEFRGERMFFKIDYYDLSLDYGSENPGDASQTVRVITIMLAGDY